ncbi:MAG: hypothetical protein HC808_01125 [Candidatus Competibacteraceae bacterium]|nr:hypothetical protein [Candidatus Competibacteraceae bacterium]
MGRRNDHSREEIREMALQAAESIVVERGLAGLSARKIARASATRWAVFISYFAIWMI